MSKLLNRLALRCAELIGSHWAFIAALIAVSLWILTGPPLHFSDTWQLVINTGSSIITLLTVFLIQNSQNRDTKAIQLKLDELIRAVKDARNSFVDAEELDDEEIKQLKKELSKVNERAHDLKGKI
jgi:low affinity Fe/Cu permease